MCVVRAKKVTSLSYGKTTDTAHTMQTQYYSHVSWAAVIILNDEMM